MGEAQSQTGGLVMSSPLSLLDILAEIPDPRHRRGIRHPLSAILGLAVLAMLTGCKSYQAIAPFGRDKGFALAQVLGFRRGKTPTKATYSILFRRLDVAAFEAALARWIARRLGDGETAVIAPDGKTRMRIINEPTAASLAYGLEKKKNEVIAVFDLGGSTFDISIFDVGDGVFEVLGVNGDTHLGGDNFDQVLIDYIAEEFKKEHGIDLRKDQMALQRLKEAAERAKKDLSQATTTDINLPFITADASGPKHLTMSLTRARFEQLCEDLFERCRKPVLQALRDAGYKPGDIDEVVL